jgi:hypothetical protein
MRNVRETLYLLLWPLWRRLDRNSLITRLRSAGFSGSMTTGAQMHLARPGRTMLRAVVVALGPRRVIMILHESGAIYPCWGADANDTPFLCWVESKPPMPDEEADRG